MTPPQRIDPSPGSNASLRTANQHRVLDVLRGVPTGRTAGSPGGSADPATEGVFTQAELARATGLAPATVSNIVRELARRGPGRHRGRQRPARFVGAAGPGCRDRGRRRLRPQPRGGGGRRPGRAGARRGAPSTSRPPPTTTRRSPRPPPCSPGCRRAWATLRHVGLGLPAPVNEEVIRSSAIFPGWEGVNARAAAEATFGAPVHVENDANLGALAEHRRGVGRGHGSSVFVKISSGVGAGIIIGNELFHGAGGTAGEIGHLTLDEQGPLCRCGSRGCLEAYTSTVNRDGHDVRPAAGRRLDDIFAAAREATSRRSARSRTPACTSAGGWPASSTCSTPRSSSSAATWPGPASCCSSRHGSGCAGMHSTRSHSRPCSPRAR